MGHQGHSGEKCREGGDDTVRFGRLEKERHMGYYVIVKLMPRFGFESQASHFDKRAGLFRFRWRIFRFRSLPKKRSWWDK